MKVVRPVINLRKKGTGEDSSLNISAKLPRKEYKIGDVVKYNDMNFYVIDDSSISDKTVTLLKAEPLTVDEVNKYGKGHINRYVTYDVKAPYYRQARNQNGYGSISYLSKSNCGYYGFSGRQFASSGCTSEYDKSDFKYVIDIWTGSVFNSDDLKEDHLGYKTRLITLDELMNNLNYVIDDQGNYVKSEGTPSWVYNDKYTYLTMTPSDDSNDTIIAVKQDGNLSISGYYRVTWWADNYDGVIRPVVTLKKENYNQSEPENIKENIIVKIPDTLLSEPIIFIVIGVVLIIVGTILFICIRRKNNFNKK